MNLESIKVGTIFTLCDENGKKDEYKLSNKYNSQSSPIEIAKESTIGRAVYDKKLGDVITCNYPSGTKTVVIQKVNDMIFPEDQVRHKILTYKASVEKSSYSRADLIRMILEERQKKNNFSKPPTVGDGSNVIVVKIEGNSIVDSYSFTIVRKVTSNTRFQALKSNSLFGKKIKGSPLGFVFKYFRDGVNETYGIIKIDDAEISKETVIQNAEALGFISPENASEKNATAEDGMVIYADKISGSPYYPISTRFYMGILGAGQDSKDKNILQETDLFNDLRGKSNGYIFTYDNAQYKIVGIRAINVSEIENQKRNESEIYTISEGTVVDTTTVKKGKLGEQRTDTVRFYIGSYVKRIQFRGRIVDPASEIFRILETKTIKDTFEHDGKKFKITSIRRITAKELETVVAEGVKVKHEQVVLGLRTNRNLKRDTPTKFYLSDKISYMIGSGIIAPSGSVLWNQLIGRKQGDSFNYKGDTFRIIGIRDKTTAEENYPKPLFTMDEKTKIYYRYLSKMLTKEEIQMVFDYLGLNGKCELSLEQLEIKYKDIANIVEILKRGLDLMSRLTVELKNSVGFAIDGRDRIL